MDNQVLELEKSFRLALARRKEAEAYEMVRRAEQHLKAANEFWEMCCTDVRMLEEVN